jgi:hypothetical protein
MTETGQIIFMVMAIIALASLASMPSWGTAIEGDRGTGASLGRDHASRVG